MRRSPVALAVMVAGLTGVAASLTACGSSPEPTATTPIYITSVPAGSLQSSSVPVAPAYSVPRTPPPLTGACTGFSASLIGGFTGAPTPQLAAQAASAHRLGGLPQPRSPWTVVAQDKVGTTLQADNSQLHAVQSENATWGIDGGKHCPG
jgi:hypothetical protein